MYIRTNKYRYEEKGKYEQKTINTYTKCARVSYEMYISYITN